MFIYLIFFACIALSFAQIPGAPYCSDESGAFQDFWYSLKLPTVSSSNNPNIASGTGHIYHLSTQINAVPRRNQFTFSNLSMASNSSLLGRTLQPVYASIISPRNDTFFFAFNDDPPNLAVASSTYAHAKSVIFFNQFGGFALVHSMPNFPDLNASNPFTIPDSATIYGQSLLCLSLPPSAIDQLGVDYRIYNPKIYASTYSANSASSLPAGLAAIYPRLALFLSGTRNTSTAAADWSKISTQNGVQFTHFTKNPKWAQDLYGNLVAPYFKSPLWVESWMRPFQPSLYPPDVPFEVINVYLLYDPASGVSWQESQDHSKYAISVFPSQSIVCVGDINKQLSQANRGGGTYCIMHPQLHRVFSSVLLNVTKGENWTMPNATQMLYPDAVTCAANCNACQSSLPSDCMTCSSPFVLQPGVGCQSKCLPGFFANSSACTSCSSSCSSCSSSSASSCSACVPPSVLLPGVNCRAQCPVGFFNQSGTCSSCSANCDSCSSSSATMCSKCTSPFVLVAGVGCQSACPSGYYNSSGTCAACAQNCDSCSSASAPSCTACLAPSVLLPGVDCRAQCPVGFFNQSGSCSACSANCNMCGSAAPLDCVSCAAPFVLQPSGGCQSSCASGWFNVSGLCNTCASSCISCSSASESSCTACLAPRVLVAGIGCRAQCPVGFFNNSGTCFSCSTNCDSCSSSSATMCSKCTSPFVLVAGVGCQSACPSGYYNSSGTCAACAQNCDSCSSGGNANCVACSTGFALQPGMSCVSQCQRGTFPDNGICRSCSSTCSECSSMAECFKCAPPYVLFNRTCIAACPSGLFNSSGVCTDCARNCVSCASVSSSGCTACAPGYLLQPDVGCQTSCSPRFFASSSNLCNACAPNCLNCSAAALSACSICAPGWQLQPAQGCQMSCDSGYFAVNGKCQVCHSDCKSCIGPNSNQCSGCFSSLPFLNESTHQCQPVPSAPPSPMSEPAISITLKVKISIAEANTPKFIDLFTDAIQISVNAPRHNIICCTFNSTLIFRSVALFSGSNQASLVNFQLLPWSPMNSSNSVPSAPNVTNPSMNSTGNALSISQIASLVQSQVSNPNSTLNQALPPGTLDTLFTPQVEIQVQCLDGQWRVTCDPQPTPLPAAPASTSSDTAFSMSLGMLIIIGTCVLIVLFATGYALHRCWNRRKAQRFVEFGNEDTTSSIPMSDIALPPTISMQSSPPIAAHPPAYTGIWDSKYLLARRLTDNDDRFSRASSFSSSTEQSVLPPTILSKIVLVESSLPEWTPNSLLAADAPQH